MRCRAAGVLLNLGGGNFKAQFRRADRSGARLALILGEDELARGVAAVKPLRLEAGQSECPLAELPARIEAAAAGRAESQESLGGRVPGRKRTMGPRARVAARAGPLDPCRPGGRRCAVRRLALLAGPHRAARPGGRQRATSRSSTPSAATTSARGLELVDQLVKDYPAARTSTRRDLAAARVAVETAARPGRRLVSQQVIDTHQDPELALVARLRLARVQLAQGQPDAALKTLDARRSGRLRGALSPKCAAMPTSPRAIAPARSRPIATARGDGASTLDTGLLDLKINDLARS